MTDGPVGVGFVGAGNVLWAYLQQLDRLIPRGLAAEGPVCARRPETWPQLRSGRPGLQLVVDPLEVVESDVGVVVVITPPATHAEIARLALEHGKHVLVEKPIARSAAEARELFALARARDVHLLAAPFVQLSPSFRALWTRIHADAIGRIHTARGLYGNAGSTWAGWYHEAGAGPLEDVGVYNLKSLTSLLGPVAEVLAAETTALPSRTIAGAGVIDAAPDVMQLIIRHVSGALSSVVASHAIQRYHRPALELYGTEGTANLLGDDWDPAGFELWRNEASSWEQYEAPDRTWLWTDGLRELVEAVHDERAPLADPEQDLHLLEVIDASRSAAATGCAVTVASRFAPLDLALEAGGGGKQLHDRTRPADRQ